MEVTGRGSAWLERVVRDQEVGGSHRLPPTNSFNKLQGLDHQTTLPTAHPVPTLPLRVRAPILRPWRRTQRPTLRQLSLRSRNPLRLVPPLRPLSRSMFAKSAGSHNLRG